MENITTVTIGDADKGGFWFKAGDIFEDGFLTAWEASKAAMAEFETYEIYYRCWSAANRRFYMIPGETNVEGVAA